MAFSVRARIGRGRTVETFLAHLAVEGESLDVAVKRPRPEFVYNDAFTLALVRWGDREKEIEHENVVAVLEAGRTSDSAYVIQEYVAGASLARALDALRKRKRTVTLPFALSIAERVSGALAALHARGIAHGGLDPGEIQIAYTGTLKVGDQRLHGLDVHLGRDLADDLGQAAIYRAPELALGTAEPTPASDVYALALIILEMLIGYPVWAAASMTVDASILALRDFTHVGQADPKLTEELVEILQLCTERSPANRAPSGKEVQAGLTRIVQKNGLSADGRSLGLFVRALVPPPRGEDAPTRMVEVSSKDVDTKTQLSPSSDLPLVDGASVVVDPDLERKALIRLESTAGARPLTGGGGAPPLSPLGAPISSAVERGRSMPRISRVAFLAALASKESDLAARGRGWRRLGVLLALFVLGLAALHFSRTRRDEHVVQVFAGSIPTGAELELDGRAVGRTPVTASAPSRDGKVKLTFRLEGYEPHEVSIDTEQDEVRYEARLRKAGGE